MSFKDFFNNLVQASFPSFEALQIERLAAQQAGQRFLKEGEPKLDGQAMDNFVAVSRDIIWQEIDREMKKGVSVEAILKLLSSDSFL